MPAAARARGHATQRLHGAPERAAAAAAAPSRGQPPGHAASPKATVLQRRRPRWSRWRRPRRRRRLQRRRTAAASRRPCLTLACCREPKTVFNTETPTHVKSQEENCDKHENSCARTACRSAEIISPFELDNLGRHSCPQVLSLLNFCRLEFVCVAEHHSLFSPNAGQLCCCWGISSCCFAFCLSK